MLPPGFLQVGVRRTRQGRGVGEVFWTDDPEALARKWAEEAKMMSGMQDSDVLEVRGPPRTMFSS